MILQLLVGILLIFAVLHRRLVVHFFRYVFATLRARPYKRLKSKSFDQDLNAEIKLLSLQRSVRKHFGTYAFIFFFITIVLLGLLITDNVLALQTKHIITTDEQPPTFMPTRLQYIPSELPLLGLEAYKVHIVEVGCYGCSHTQQHLIALREALSQTQGLTQYRYINAPVNDKEIHLQQLMACIALAKPSEYWKIHTQLLEYQAYRDTPSEVLSLFSIPATDIDTCMKNKLYEPSVTIQNQFITDHQVSEPSVIYVGETIYIGTVETQSIIKIIKSTG